MDADRFDTLVRSLSTTPTRRGALRLLSGTALVSLLTFGTMPADAKKGGNGKGRGAGKKKAGKKDKKCKSKEKVTICHKGQTIQVSSCAVKAHQKHGDTLGECQNQTPPPSCQPPCTGGKICQSNGTCACPATMSPCAADGSCVATELCCTGEDPSCPAATFESLECEDGVCVCANSRKAPCRRSNGDWYCCGARSTCCNDDACCEATCTVQAGACACPGSNEPCSIEDEDSGVTFLSCCADGDTCCADDSLECCTTQCTAANSTRGGPIARCGGASNQCQCATSLEDDSHVCVDYGQGFACVGGVCSDGSCTNDKICVDNISCGLAPGETAAQSCVSPCA